MDELVALAKVSHPIPFRTRSLNPLAPMVLCLKTRESRSPPVLLFTVHLPLIYLILFVLSAVTIYTALLFYISAYPIAAFHKNSTRRNMALLVHYGVLNSIAKAQVEPGMHS